MMDEPDMKAGPVATTRGLLQRFVGHQVAILTTGKNHYRGIVHSVQDQSVVLEEPRIVLSSGRPEDVFTNREERLTDVVMLGIGAIELVWRPEWCKAKLGG